MLPSETQMDQVERDSVSRSHNIVYTLPRNVEALKSIISAQIERIDPSEATLQLIVFTPDAETTIRVASLCRNECGAQKKGITTVPVTSARRAARLLKNRPVQIVIGSPAELQWILQQSLLKLEGIKTAIVAFADEISGPAANEDELKAFEAIFGDIPRESARILTASSMTPEVEQLVERYLLKARRFDETTGEVPGTPTTDKVVINAKYIATTETGKPGALQRVLDELDAPSAVIVVDSPEDRPVVLNALAELGYSDEDDIVWITEGEIPTAVHTAIYYRTPTTRKGLEKAAKAEAANLIVLATGKEINFLRQVTDTLAPVQLNNATMAAKRRDKWLRQELTDIIESGTASRELLSLEPLLEIYEGYELAAAAVKMMENERIKVRAKEEEARKAALNQPRPERSERPPRSFESSGDDRGPRSGGGERPPRFGGSREGGSSGDRDRKPSFGGDRDRKPFGGDRDRKPYGGGGERRSFGGGGGGERRPFGGGGERRPFGGDRDRKPYGGGGGGERRPFGGDRERRPFGGGDDRRSFGGDRDRKPYGGGGGGERRPFGGDRGRSSFGGGDRDRKPYGGGGDRRPFGGDRDRKPPQRDGERSFDREERKFESDDN